MFFKNQKPFIARFAAILTLLVGIFGATSVQAGPVVYQVPVISPGDTVRVSNALDGGVTNGFSGSPSISADGRYVAFTSLATNLVSDDTNGVEDIFVYDIQTGITTRASVDSNGMQANGGSSHSSISADGRYVVFTSSATNLVPADTNGRYDVFMHDMQTGLTMLVSVDSSGAQLTYESNYSSVSGDGRYVTFETYGSDVLIHDMQTGLTTPASVDSSSAQADRTSYSASISADGYCVAFTSPATNLVVDDTNEASDIFVHDIQTELTTRVSMDSNGVQANSNSERSAISGDGRYIALDSYASNLVPDDTNWRNDVFVHDRQTGVTTRVSVDSSGMQADGGSSYPAISADGRYVAFLSSAPNLVPDDTNGAPDVFVHDVQTGITRRVSVDSSGAQANNRWSPSSAPAISADGQYIAFDSDATNLVPGDTTQQDVFLHRQDVLPSPATPTPTYTLAFTPTFTPTDTPTYTPTFTPTYIPTDLPPTYTYYRFLLSLTDSQVINGVDAADEDLLGLNGVTQNLDLVLNGSGLGLGSTDLTAFSILDDSALLMSFSSDVTIDGISATPQDVLRFDPIFVGVDPVGTFSMYFDGSDVGLNSTAESIDALALRPDGTLLISTTGNLSVPGFTTGRDEDVLAFTPTSLGATTSGAWSLYFDGSDAGLGESSGEDIDALDVVDGKIYLSTEGDFSVNGISGADEDVFVCTEISLGETTACEYAPVLYFDGSTQGMADNDVDAFHCLESPNVVVTPPPAITLMP